MWYGEALSRNGYLELRGNFVAIQGTLRGLDVDNDSTFINDTLVSYCRDNKIELTRCRAYKKSDQSWIEQKNGAVIRRMVGYGRLEGAQTAAVLNKMYTSARLFVNFFQPPFKLLSKPGRAGRHADIVPAAFDDPLHLLRIKRQLLGVFDGGGAAHELGMVFLDPTALHGKSKECSDALDFLHCRPRADLPGVAELPKELDVELLEVPETVLGGEVFKLTEHQLVFASSRFAESSAALGILQELLFGVGDRSRLGLLLLGGWLPGAAGFCLHHPLLGALPTGCS